VGDLAQGIRNRFKGQGERGIRNRFKVKGALKTGIRFKVNDLPPKNRLPRVT